MDFKSCNIRVTNLQEIDGGSANVNYVFLCPGDGNKAVPSYSEHLCAVLVNSMGDAQQCQMQSGVVTTRKPDQKTPAVE